MIIFSTVWVDLVFILENHGYLMKIFIMTPEGFLFPQISRLRIRKHANKGTAMIVCYRALEVQNEFSADRLFLLMHNGSDFLCVAAI